MGMHFYIKGTEGAQDGEELSQGDLSNPLIFDGFYPGTGVTLYKELPVYLRADKGETYYLVQVEIRGNSARKFRMADTVGSNGGGQYGYDGSASIQMGDTRYYRGAKLIGKVTDVNSKIVILASASGDETDSPDFTTKIYARSCYHGAS